MNLHLHFILVNSEFNKGLADDLYNGEESEDNIKHLWEDEFQVSEPVKEFKISNNAIYKLAGFFPDDKPFSFEICGGPHVNHTLELYEGDKKFKIIKEESSSAGIRRIKAIIG